MYSPKLPKKSERQQIKELLQNRAMTAYQIHVVTGIREPNICRRKREFEDAGILFVLGKTIDCLTHHRANLLTMNVYAYTDYLQSLKRKEGAND